jgi:PAS domain-containing protein
MRLNNSDGVSSKSKENHNRRYLKAITNNASVALFIMDEQQHCVFMNPAAEKLTGLCQSQRPSARAFFGFSNAHSETGRTGGISDRRCRFD